MNLNNLEIKQATSATVITDLVIKTSKSIHVRLLRIVVRSRVVTFNQLRSRKIIIQHPGTGARRLGKSGQSKICDLNMQVDVQEDIILNERISVSLGCGLGKIPRRDLRESPLLNGYIQCLEPLPESFIESQFQR